MLREHPLVYVEGTKNVEARKKYEIEIPPVLRVAPGSASSATVLMNTSVYPEIVALTGIPLRQTINESDLEIYSNALAAPAAHADLILAFDGDQVDSAVKAHPQGLSVVRQFTTAGQPSATLYLSGSSGAASLTQPPERC